MKAPVPGGDWMDVEPDRLSCLLWGAMNLAAVLLPAALIRCAG